MALTITTKYLSVTTTRGARIKVSCSNGVFKTYGYDHQASEPHVVAIWEFLNDVFDVIATTITQQETMVLPIAGLHQDTNGNWYTNAGSMDNKGYTVIIDRIQVSKWNELNYLL